MILALLVGGLLGVWVWTVVAVAYVLWRYAYCPFRVLRADLQALATRVRDLSEEIGLRKVPVLSEADVARAEARQRLRQQAMAEWAARAAVAREALGRDSRDSG